MTQTGSYRNAPYAQLNSPPIARDANPDKHLPGLWLADFNVACLGCGEPSKIRFYQNGLNYPGHAAHLLALWDRPQQPAEEPEREPDRDELSMFRLLTESVTASRKHPVLRVAKDQRAEEPWSLMVETMRGEHRYRIDAPDGSTVKTLDRNGSYPAAMANVPVAAGTLKRMGSVGYSTGQAGIYLIPAFTWENGPHPLGEIADQDTDTWWISTPHMRLCMRLAAHHRIEVPRILDSWTAQSVTNLFKQFSADVSERREASRGDADEYADVKRKSSIAIRGLWPKGARSPFWRPDWSISTRAEASVRHWVRADQAMTAGAELVKLGSVDEVAFVVPKRARTDWLPEPYHEGTGFGYVKTKGVMPAAEFNRRGVRRGR